MSHGGLLGKEDPSKLFSITEEIAVGSYGRVFRARHKPTGDVVALKTIAIDSGESLDEFLVSSAGPFFRKSSMLLERRTGGDALQLRAECGGRCVCHRVTR